MPLWDDEPDELPPTRPPVPWIKRHGQTTGGYSAGCRCGPCTAVWRDYNQLLRQGLRRCRRCQQTFTKEIGAGGSKFCATCRANGTAYNPATTPHPERECARCGTTYRAKARRWKLCPACTAHPVFKQMMTSFNRHNASEALIAQPKMRNASTTNSHRQGRMGQQSPRRLRHRPRSRMLPR